MSLWISLNFCPLNLLLVRSPQAETIIVKHLLRGRNNVAGSMRGQPRSCDQDRRKNNALTLSATLPTECAILYFNLLSIQCHAGIGLTVVVISFYVGIFYTVIIAYAAHYFILSFMNPLPWTTCQYNNSDQRCSEVTFSSNAVQEVESKQAYLRKIQLTKPAILHSSALEFFVDRLYIIFPEQLRN